MRCVQNSDLEAPTPDGSDIVGTYPGSYGDGEDYTINVMSGDVTPPNCTVITPSTTGPTNANSVNFDVRFDEPVTGFTAANDLVISHSGYFSFRYNDYAN